MYNMYGENSPTHLQQTDSHRGYGVSVGKLNNATNLFIVIIIIIL